ncbi:RidA family protein [Rhizobium skierniewicense]|uniref:RidA family protein n=1 Tax=Rhizobium skierniewicense TaxID=984260 RepID=UPI001573B1BC|nr:RidA family protein [Rhizobium skierniewicense]NTF34404.1 RidA family protein [Rhizobium skierniewicense]
MQRISTNSLWEERSGYSRAVVAGGLVFISATAATDSSGAVVGKGDVYTQTRMILDKLAAVLIEANSALDRVVQTRVYITDISLWEEVGRAHGETFAGHRPALSMVHVKPFVDSDMLVEIEMVASTGVVANVSG